MHDIFKDARAEQWLNLQLLAALVKKQLLLPNVKIQ